MRVSVWETAVVGVGTMPDAMAVASAVLRIAAEFAAMGVSVPKDGISASLNGDKLLICVDVWGDDDG